jgi:hypothetical protein
MSLSKLGLRGACALSAALALSACSADPVSGGRAGQGTAGAFDNPAGGVGGVGGAGSGGTSGFGNPIGGSSGTAGAAGTVGGSGAGGMTGMCGGDAYAAQTKPLDIYVMMDESLSMIVPVDIWTPTASALNQFFASPDTAGISVGIAFFSGGCDIPAYQTPVVPVGELPANAMGLQMALAARFPGPGTATEPAVRGALAFAKQRAGENPDRKQVVLLVTDGEPASCGATVESTSVAAAEGLMTDPSVPMYVLGLGNINGLNQMAEAGGTGQAFVVSDPMQVQAVVDAMNAIRGLALPCEYRVPTPTTGSFDKMRVNLNWTQNGATTVVPFVGDPAGCEGAAMGWHYDNADAPTQLVACPQTCDAFKANGGDVSVTLGCPIVVVM